jgi:AcrR family transcriptional regulator
MNKEIKPELDLSTEEKIKSAARKLFTRRGFDAVKTREIAAEAGINLALLNYYFRSKEKLFEMVMFENMATFVQGAAAIMNDEKTALFEKFRLLVEHYINILSKNPDVPHFVLNAIKNHPETLAEFFRKNVDFFNTTMVRQIQEEMKKGRIVALHPAQFLINLISMTVFPFVMKPLLMNAGSMNESDFAAILEERKKMIPIWLENMYKPQQ